jgi:hypothetical protein
MKDDPQLRELLRTSLPDVQLPRRFGAEVWQRIQARSEVPAKSVWAKFFEPLSVFLRRPAYAAVALVLAVGGGAAVGSLRATDANERARAALIERHVATIDPYVRLAAMR